MKNNKSIEDLKKNYFTINIPCDGIKNMEKAIEKAKVDKIKITKINRRKSFGVGIAAALALVVILPNTNSTVAMAMEKIPVIGKVVNVVTFDRFTLKNNNYEANIDIPQIETTDKDGSNAIVQVNDDIETYTNALVEQFKKDVSKTGEGHQGLDMSYDVVTDTNDWFTLKINVLETKASGFEYSRFYHINKLTGKTAQLKDLFVEDSDYVNIITNNIKEQMRYKMKNDNAIYFLEDDDMPTSNFETIKSDQNFYFDSNDNLVIAFDEYEVAPGYMGCPQFLIPNEVLKDVLK